MKIIPFNKTYSVELQDFINNLGNSANSFRYFKTRSLDVLKNHIVTLIVIYNNKVIGYGHLDFENSTTWLGIAVSPHFIGKGIGKLIMSKLIEAAKVASIGEIKLAVDSSNENAIRLYQKFGFIQLKKEFNIIYFIKYNIYSEQ